MIWKEKLKRFLIRFLLVLFIFFSAMVFYFAKIDGDISPFLICFLLALLFVNIKKIGNPKLKFLLLIAVFSLTQLHNLITSSNTERALASLLIGYIFLSAMYISLKTYERKKLSTPWTVEQIVSLLAVLVVFSLGLACIKLPYFDLHKFLVVLVILVGVYFAEPKTTIMIAAVIALGKSFESNNLIYVADYVLIAISCYCFIARIPIYSFVAVILTDFVLAFYFGGYMTYDFVSLVPILLAIAVFLCLPKFMSRYFVFGKSILNGFLVSKNEINKNNLSISYKMHSLSRVFNEMQNTYRGLTHGELPPEAKARLFLPDIINGLCYNCPNKTNCKKTPMQSKDIDDGIFTAAKTAFRKGQLTVFDLPNIINVKCGKTYNLLEIINSFVSQYHDKQEIIDKTDSSKILMANLLSGMSSLCGNFADEICASVVFDTDRAAYVKEDLLYKDIVVEDVLITKNGKNEFTVSILIPRESVREKIIEKVVSGVCGHKMVVDDITDAETRGFAIVSVRSAPKYGVAFAYKSLPKELNKLNGDSISVLKIAKDKYLMAICDGMGAGEQAMRASTLALSLIENFYKAGFPDEIVLQSVNQLLTISGGEVFSAIDIVIIDLVDGNAHFIKQASPESYIKRHLETEIVEGGALPIGILSDITPKILSAHITSGDFIVLISDGILDAFGGAKSELKNFINNLNPLNKLSSNHLDPQYIVSVTMEETLKRSKNLTADDCSILVAKLI
ncbi:MAG: SpoIIE family protein phosphatase [Christensenellaceae bacterium]|jgi:stage II sporulation protein E|nr:SpoIIE family protein phosphatase [Christensenellaceae bacterium]